MTGTILTCSDSEYYADPCEVPSLSVSIAKVLVTRTPKRAHAMHPRLGGTMTNGQTSGMRGGTAVDELIFGGDRVRLVSGFENWRTNAAKEARDRWVSLGCTPMLDHEYAEAVAAADAIRASLPAHGLNLEGSKQLAITWESRASNGNPVTCRAKLDLFDESAGLIWDLKTVDEIDPDGLARTIKRFGYHMQGAAYREGIGEVFPDLCGRVDFCNFFAERSEPYDTVRVNHSGALRSLGELLWRRAVDTWEECLRTGEWPSYTSAITADATPWEIEKEAGYDSEI